jgi:hypothetical protein
MLSRPSKYSRPIITASGSAKVVVRRRESGCLHTSSVIASVRVTPLQVGIALIRLVLGWVVLRVHIVVRETDLCGRRISNVWLVSIIFVLIVLVCLGARKRIVVVGIAVCTVTSMIG